MIREVRVQNYKSIRNSGWVDISDRITTLVGGNEAGKTNFLESITLLGSSRTVNDSELCDYNSTKLKSKEKDNIILIEAKIPLPYLYSELGVPRMNKTVYRNRGFDEEIVLGNETNVEDREVIARRYADGTHRLEFRGESQDVRRYLQYTISERIEELQYSVTVRQISKDLDSRLRRLTNTADKNKYNRIEDFLSVLQEIKSYVIENREIIIESVSDSEGEKTPTQLIKEIVGMVDSYQEREDVILHKSDLELFPSILFFDDIDEIKDEEKIEELEEDSNVSAAYSSLLYFAGLEPSNLSDLDSGQIRDQRQQAEEKLTQLFNEYWGQSNIDIKIELSGGRVSIHLYDDSEIRKQPSDRSTGLRWFLSFLSRVITQSEEGFVNSIILLDDPGVHLHPNGHKDLRKALKRLAEDNQVLYSTHAPYMINTNKLSWIRVVEREEQGIGTKVKRIGGKNTVSDDSLASVRASLGATFSDSLFSSKYTILVEGFEDRVYLNRFSEYFRRNSKGPFFDADMKIVDCGGASKTNYMSRLVNAEDYEYAVLLDSDRAGHRAKETLIQDRIPEERITLVSDIMETEGDFSIEDLFSEEFFCQIVSEVHDLDKEQLLESLSQNSKPLVKRVDNTVKQIERIDTSGIVINKRKIAKKIDRGISEGEYPSEKIGNETLQNFELVIRAIIESFATEKSVQIQSN